MNTSNRMLRQAVSVIGVAGVTAAALGALGQMGNGRWRAPSTDFRAGLAALAPPPRGGSYRVLWAGDPAVVVAPSYLAYTVGRRGSHRRVRTAVVAASLAEVATKLRDVADGDTPYLPAVGQDDRGPVWVFSGQESWYTKPGARCARGTKLRRRGRN